MQFNNLNFSQDLIELAKNGDKKAMEKILSGFEHLAYYTALSFLKDIQQSEDAAQDALLKIAKNIHGFQNRSKLSTWGYRIIRNCIYDVIRKEKKMVFDNLNDTNSSVSDDLTEKMVISNESWQKIKEILGVLSQEKREIIILFDIQGYSFREISELLDMPEGTVKSKWSRAKNRLRKELLKKKIIQVEPIDKKKRRID